MKFILSQMAFFLAQQSNQRNLKFMLRFMGMLLVLIIVYSAMFHLLMKFEGREYSTITGLYWTLTVMSTLGFGDITFSGDLGRVFSIVVTLSGILLFMLVMPFTFIRFVYAPWLEAQSQAAVRVKLPEDTAGHVIVAGTDDVTFSVVERLRQSGIPYVHLLESPALAMERNDRQFSVMVGRLDVADTYKSARVEQASLVVTLCDDWKNTNIASTVRSVSSSVRIASSVEHEDSVDILQLAGSTYTYPFHRMLGSALARRVFRPTARSNIIARIEGLCIAEVPASNTPYTGKALCDTDIRTTFGLTVVGIWHGKEYSAALADTVIDDAAILLIAGTHAHVRDFDASLVVKGSDAEDPVLVLGGGRVGHAVVEALEKRGLDFRVVEIEAANIPRDDPRFIIGSAADIAILRKASIETTQTIIVTTHNDDLNVYLTIYCRKLKPDVQIISRATLDQNVEALYNAGANLVMSHSTMGANVITNLLRPGRVTMLTEGLNIFRVATPKSLSGTLLKDSRIRIDTRCNVVAVNTAEGMKVPPDPDAPLADTDELILLGSVEAEQAFMEKYS